MRVVLVSIDAKYIHTNLAVRLLKANTTYPVDLLEFTIKDGLDTILEQIASFQADVVGFSVYLWNRDIVVDLIDKIKSTSSSKIILGGPEVSYDVEELFIKTKVDFVISGEGEIAFHQLLEALDQSTPFQDIQNLSYKNNEGIHSNTVTPIPVLANLKSGYQVVPINPHKIQYIESSRGCPYRCSYCLASLDKPVRYFDEEQLKENLLELINSNARVFKFLDRTFNAHINRSKRVFDFIIKHHRVGQSFQFEITGDVFPQSLIDYLHEVAPKHLFRFEIGIQSTNLQTNQLVDRIQNNQKLFQMIECIQKHQIIDLHLDLIAGLPKETKSIFQKTFNEVFALRPSELQLGFLKFLKGTKIRQEAQKYDYLFQENPPYEIIQSTDISIADLKEIHKVEEMLEIFWNKRYFPLTFEQLKELEDPYSFFYKLYEFLPKPISKSLPMLAQSFESFLTSNPDYDLASRYVKIDYLKHHPIKPKIWWEQAPSIQQRKQLIRTFQSKNPIFLIDDLYKRAVLVPHIDTFNIAIFEPAGVIIFPLLLE
jgi:anaerobic magnesium-protoporphyrin IX monomethyl ester cyclase